MVKVVVEPLAVAVAVPVVSELREVQATSVAPELTANTWLAVPLARRAKEVPLFLRRSPAVFVVECFIVLLSTSTVLFVRVSVVALPTMVSVTLGNVRVLLPARVPTDIVDVNPGFESFKLPEGIV